MPMTRKEVDALVKDLASVTDQPEPVAWYDKHGAITHDPFEGVTPLYTTPPQREWQGLTDEEEEQCRIEAGAKFRYHRNSIRGQIIMPADDPEWHFIRAIEAKLKEKNGG